MLDIAADKVTSTDGDLHWPARGDGQRKRRPASPSLYHSVPSASGPRDRGRSRKNESGGLLPLFFVSSSSFQISLDTNNL